MMGILGQDRFEVGKDYSDAIGRTWTLKQKFNVNGWPCYIAVTEWAGRKYWHPAIVEDSGNTATVLLDEGFTTIYAEEASQ